MPISQMFAHALRHSLLALVGFACLGAGNAALAQEERFIPQDMRACTAEHAAAGYTLPCKQALPAERVAPALDKLKKANFAYEVKGDTLFVAVRMTPDEVPYPKGPYLCCEVDAYLDKIADKVYAASFRWNRMESAMLDLQFLNVQNRPDARLQHNGSPQFVFADSKIDEGLIARSGAELSTRLVDAGSVLGARKVSVFKGAACRQTLARCSLIYMPDGHTTRLFVSNALANDVDMNSFVVVGVHNAVVNGNETRIAELLLGYDEARYDAFMRFVTHDLKRQVEGGETPLRRYAAGYSNGGSWAHNALVSQGGHFDGAIVMSPGERKTRGDGPLAGRVVVVGAGYMEREFHESALAIAAGLRSRGAAVSEVYVPSGHGTNTWVNVWNAAIVQFNGVR